MMFPQENNDLQARKTVNMGQVQVLKPIQTSVTTGHIFWLILAANILTIFMAVGNDTSIMWTISASGNGRFFATGSSNGVLNIYQAKNNKIIKSFNFPHAVQSISWNSNQPLLAIGLDDAPAKIINTETYETIDTETKHGSRALDWNPDGTLLAIGDYEGILSIVNQKGKIIKEIKKGNSKSYLSVHWHPQSSQILTGSDRITSFDTSGKVILDFKHREENTIVLTVRWHPDGNFFASGDYGHKEENVASLLQFWSTKGDLIKTFSDSKAEYRNIRWNKAGTALATTSDALRIWSPEKGLIITKPSKTLLWGLSWLEQDLYLVTGDMNGRLKKWLHNK